MTISVMYNGTEITQYMDRVLDITRNVGQNRTPQFQKIGHTNGEAFQYTTASAGTITMTARIRNQKMERRRALARILMTAEPVTLTFSDEPDLYYTAITSGQQALAEQFLNNTLSLTFSVGDALAHAVSPKDVTGASTMDFVVDNMGSAPTPPILTATIHGDNGVVAFTNDQGGVLQFGDPEEVDGVTKSRAEQALRVGFDSDPGGTANNVNGATNYPNFGGVTGQTNARIGAMQFVKDTIGGTSMQPVFDNASQKYWAGPSREIAIPKNSAGSNTGNCWIVGRFQFDTSAKARGRVEYTFCNGNSVVMSIVLRDSTSAGDSMVLECWNEGTLLASVNLDRKVFKNKRYFQLKMYRFSSRIGFQIAPVNSVTANSKQDTATLGKVVLKEFEIANRDPITSASIWFERWQQSQHTIMGVSDLLFSWTDVDYWTDLANRFSDGDVVTADVANKAILVNGVEDMTLHTVGNTWDSFLLQPGENTIQAIQSSWAATPMDVDIGYREAYY